MFTAGGIILRSGGGCDRSVAGANGSHIKVYIVVYSCRWPPRAAVVLDGHLDAYNISSGVRKVACPAERFPCRNIRRLNVPPNVLFDEGFDEPICPSGSWSSWTATSIAGKVVQIDFGDGFDLAMHREKIADRVPFRFTGMLTHAMEVRSNSSSRYSAFVSINELTYRSAESR